MVGKLPCHRQVQSTARYAHLAQESVKASSARVQGKFCSRKTPNVLSGNLLIMNDFSHRHQSSPVDVDEIADLIDFPMISPEQNLALRG